MTESHSLCARLSLAEVSDLIARREVSPLEVVQDALALTRRLEPTVGAFITLTEDVALRQAQTLQDEWARGQLRGPLHGIPVGYQDNIATRQVRTTANSRSRADWIPSRNADVVNRLEEAGAVSMGKLMLWELAGGAPSPHSLYPSPRNPWALDRTPGGSSSGPAAAVATGFCLAAVGTDTDGSVRLPAAACGLVGLKPTFGSLSTEGVIPFSRTLDHLGPITRTVADNLLMLLAMGFDPTAPGPAPATTHRPAPPSLEGCRAEGMRGLRLGVPWHMLETFGYDPDCQQAFADALQVLEALGATLDIVRLPMLEQASVWGGEMTVMEAYEVHGARLETHPEEFDSPFSERVLQARRLSDEQRTWLRESRQRCQEEWQTVRQQVDVVVTPTSKGGAETLAETLRPGYGPRANYTRMYNVSGMPALAMPMGWSPEGLPLSIQFASGPHEEALLYRVALAYEEATGFTRRRPPLLANAVAGATARTLTPEPPQ